MTYCEVGLTCSPPARSLSKAYYWWESNKSPAKSGRERRRRFFDGTNCQFRPIHRSSPPRPGRISLAPIAHTCELGEARVGHFSPFFVQIQESNLLLRCTPGERSASRAVSFRRAEQTGAQLFAAVKSIACPTTRSFLRSFASSQTFRIDGAASRPPPRKAGAGGEGGTTVIGSKAAVNFSALLFFHHPGRVQKG